MESIIIKKQIAQQKAIERLQLRQADTMNYTTFNQPASLTLTRTNSLAITTAGTIITWESENRNSGFTWSGTDITIPASGYYSVQCFFLVSNAMTLNVQQVINGVVIGIFIVAQNLTTNYFPATMTKYFTIGDIFSIRVVPSTNSFITVNAENNVSESPILHIAQLTGVLP